MPDLVTVPALPDHLVGVAPIDVVEARGADRLAFLDDLVTQRVVDARPGQVLGAMELEQHGSALALLDVAVTDDLVLLLVPRAAPREDTPKPLTPPGQSAPEMPDLATSVAVRMGARTFLKDATFSVRDDLAVVREAGAGLAGPDPATAGTRGSVAVVDDGWLVVRDGERDHVVPVDRVEALVDRLAAEGADRVDVAALEALRVVRGEPAWGSEVAAPHLPEELGLLGTHVHLAKGCYPGQEAVARMWMLGRPRRRLAGLDLDPGVGPGFVAGSGRGRVEVTSAAEVGGERTGLGFVGVQVAVGDEVRDDDGVGVRVVWVAPDDLDVPGHDPAVTRRRDR